MCVGHAFSQAIALLRPSADEAHAYAIHRNAVEIDDGYLEGRSRRERDVDVTTSDAIHDLSVHIPA